MNITLNDVLLRPPVEVKIWLDSVHRGDTIVPPEFNWLGLAEAASAEAARCSDDEESLSWGEIAGDVYDSLRRQSESASAAHSMLLSAMNLQANMIIRFGRGAAGSIRDLDQILTLFRLNTPFESHSAVSRLLQKSHWSVEEMRRLRFLKNMLGPIQRLAQHGFIDHASDLASWVSLVDKLP